MPQAESVRKFLEAWLDARGDKKMPSPQEFGPFQMRPYLPHVAVYRKMPEGRFKVTLQGTGLVEAFGFDATGMYLDDIYPRENHPELNNLYDLLFGNGYLSHSIRTYERKSTGAIVTIEQVMVPMSNEDGEHDRYVLLAYNVPMPQRPRRGEVKKTVSLGILEERTIFDARTLLPVACDLTTPRAADEMVKPLI